MNAFKNVFGLKKEAEPQETVPEFPPEEESSPTRRKMQKAKNGKKYANIDCLEEKAYQILKDLDMIEEYN